MGSHATAYMFYGYNLNHDEGDCPIANVDDFDGEAAIERALHVTGKPYEERAAARAKCDVEFLIHCSFDCPCYVLAISSSIVRSYQGEATSVDTPDPNPTWKARLDEIASRLRVDLSKAGVPGWFICSIYG